MPDLRLRPFSCTPIAQRASAIAIHGTSIAFRATAIAFHATGIAIPVTPIAQSAGQPRRYEP